MVQEGGGQGDWVCVFFATKFVVPATSSPF